MTQRICLRIGATLLPWTEVRFTAPAVVRDADVAGLQLDRARAIESLPVTYRAALILRDIEGFGIAQIAARTGATSAAVKAQLHRARKLMREYLTAG